MNSQPNSLTEIAYYSRNTIKWGLISIASAFLLISTIRLAASAWKTRHPPPPPPADTAWGSLPVTKFEEPSVRPEGFYLETISGDLPQTPSQENVYFIFAKKSKILAYEDTKFIAGKLGFSTTPENPSEDLYVYRNPSSGSQLKINPLTLNFEYQYPFRSDQTIISQKLTNTQNAITSAYSYLTSAGVAFEDINPQGKITLYTLTPTSLNKAPSISEANLARIDFSRNKIGEYPILSQNLEDPNISLWVTGESSSKAVVQAKFIYFPYDKEKVSIYPLKPITQAWDELLAGNYHQTNLENYQSGKVAIRNVFLAYMDPHYPMEFLKPFYVFEGDNKFVGVVEAISSEFLAE